LAQITYIGASDHEKYNQHLRPREFILSVRT
jgi:hypothetical protein